LLADLRFCLCSIVFANKTVFTVLNFRFVYTLTLLHVVTTLLGMRIFAALGFYERRPLPIRPLLSLSASFVGYIVFWNLSLQVDAPRLLLMDLDPSIPFLPAPVHVCILGGDQLHLLQQFLAAGTGLARFYQSEGMPGLLGTGYNARQGNAEDAREEKLFW
jgi:hypothetical protein